MTHYDWGNTATGTTVHAVDIAAANAASFDPDQDLVVLDLRLIYFFVLKLAFRD